MTEDLQQKFPFAILEGFGLTREMIEDLPKHVIDTICSGGRSPLFPINIPTKYGYISAQAKFRLSPILSEEGTYGLIFYPKMEIAHLDDFTPEEKGLLLEGKAILAEISIQEKDNPEIIDHEKCFVQIDRDTNHVFYVHAPVIARNLKSADNVIELDPVDFEILKKGGIVTKQEPEQISIGIDLMSDTGVFICSGSEDTWKTIVGKTMPKYYFGLDGCWINDNGSLRYVREEDFDADIEKALKESARTNNNPNAERSLQLQESQGIGSQRRTEDNQQVTR